jgi:hypothetical protein
MGDSDLRHAHAQVAQTIGETHIGDAHLGLDGCRFRREGRDSGRGRGRGDALTWSNREDVCRSVFGPRFGAGRLGLSVVGNARLNATEEEKEEPRK